MAEQDVLQRLDRLQGTRRSDRFMQWLSGILGTLLTVAVSGLVMTVIDLRSSTAVSNAELRGSIDRLSDRLEAATRLSDSTLDVVRQVMETNANRIDDHEERIRGIEITIRR